VNAVVYPCTALRTARLTDGAWLRAKLAAELAATVDSSAVPTEPPTCCMVLTIADAAPAARGATPYVALLIAGAKIRPKPRPSTTSEGRTCPA